MQHTSSSDKQQEEPEVGKVLTSPLIISYPTQISLHIIPLKRQMPSHTTLRLVSSGCYWEALKKGRRTRNTDHII